MKKALEEDSVLRWNNLNFDFSRAGTMILRVSGYWINITSFQD